jgi:TonB family protein
VFAWSPGPGAPKLPGVVTVDLVAMAAPAAAPAAARAAARPASPPPAPPRAAEAPTPVPAPTPPAPAPPKPEPPRREAVLPKTPAPPEPKKPRERAKADPKPEPKPEPKPAAKPEPRKPEPAPAATAATAAKPAPKKLEPAAKPPPRQEEAYDDVLAQLRAERGESRPARTASASSGVAGATGVAGSAARGAGTPMSADVAVWLRAAKFHVEDAWIVPPGFRREALRTVVSVRLDAGGRVLGAPRVTERSANPWYDESVVRAIQKASPLPPPPEVGEWRFEFTPPGSAG